MKMRTLILAAIVVGAISIGGIATAEGISEPSVTQYGEVRFGGATLWTTAGTVTVELTPLGGGATVSASGSIEPLPEGGAQFSYRVKLPLESILAGMSPSANTLPNAAATYNRTTTVTIAGQSEVVTDQLVFIDGELRGRPVRVDLDFDGPAPTITPTATPSPTFTPIPSLTPSPSPTAFPPGCCPGDADGNEVVNSQDYIAARDAFGEAGSSGDADCDGFVNTQDLATTFDFFGTSCLAGGSGPVLSEPPLSRGNATKPRLFLSPATANVTPGQTFTVEVRLDGNGLNPATVGAFVRFDPAKLTFLPAGTIGSQSGANRALFGNALLTADPVEKEPGIVSFPASAFSPVDGLDNRVARLTFIAGASTGATALSFENAAGRLTSVRNGLFDDLDTLRQDAVVNIAPVAAPRLFVSPATRFVEGGGDYSLEVRLDGNGRSARSTVVFVQFDPNAAQFLGGSTNTALFDDGTVTTVPSLVAPGVISVNAATTTTIGMNDQRIATLNFRPLGNASFAVTILRTTQRPSRVLDQTFTDLFATVDGGFVTQEEYVPPTPTPTATPIPTASPSATETETPSPTPTTSPTQTEEPTPTEEPTATATPTESGTPSPTATVAPSGTATPEPTASPTGEPTATASVTASPTESATPTTVPTTTPSATATATPDASPTASATPEASPSVSATPSASATASVTPTESATPTQAPPSLQEIIDALLRGGTPLGDQNGDGVTDAADIVERVSP